MRRLTMLPMLAATLLLAACSSSASSAPAASSAGGGASAPAASAAAGGGASAPAASAAAGGGAACATAPSGATAAVTVTIKDFKFSPEPVQAKVGDVIAWTNSDTAPHSATLDNGACDTKTIDVGATAMLVFTAAGTYTYHCSIHPTQMKGYTIQVQ
jgi:plastocyanin